MEAITVSEDLYKLEQERSEKAGNALLECAQMYTACRVHDGHCTKDLSACSSAFDDVKDRPTMMGVIGAAIGAGAVGVAIGIIVGIFAIPRS